MRTDRNTNRRITLAAHPQGLPVARDFHFDIQPAPTPADGEVLLRTLYLSLDPYMRNLMDETGPGYAPPVPLGEPMVGGTVSRIARVPVCGFISHYNESTPSVGADRLPKLLATVLQKRVRMQGFIILDHYAERFAAFRSDMAEWVARGRIRLLEDIVEGLEQAPAALTGLLEGRNFGKVVVRVAHAI